MEDLEELIKDLDKATLSRKEKKEIMKKAIEYPKKELISNSPRRTGKMKRTIKSNIKIDDFATVGIIRTDVFYDFMLEFGTSQQKKHIGWFSNTVDKTENTTIKIMAEGLFKKIK